MLLVGIRGITPTLLPQQNLSDLLIVALGTDDPADRDRALRHRLRSLAERAGRPTASEGLAGALEQIGDARELLPGAEGQSLLVSPVPERYEEVVQVPVDLWTSVGPNTCRSWIDQTVVYSSIDPNPNLNATFAA